MGNYNQNYNQQNVFGELDCFLVDNRYRGTYYGLNIEYFGSNESSEKNKCETINEWSESTKVIEYLKQVRQKTIDELRKAQEDSLEYLKSNSFDLNHIKESKDVEEMRSRLFADKFYFLNFINHNSQNLGFLTYSQLTLTFTCLQLVSIT